MFRSLEAFFSGWRRQEVYVEGGGTGEAGVYNTRKTKTRPLR